MPLGYGRYSCAKRKSVPVSITQSDADRFWKAVDRRGPDECWPWMRATNQAGYGRFKICSALFLPHRVSYALTHGGIEDGLGFHGTVIMHSCDNPRCCNPAHLSAGTMRQNVQDMIAKGRGGQRRRWERASPLYKRDLP